jgi:hypothetical protein
MTIPDPLHTVLLAFRWGAAVLFLLMAIMTAVMAWRFRGIFHWKRSLKQELLRIREDSANQSPEMAAAVSIVLAQCQKFWCQSLIRVQDELDMTDFIRSIASCFHPDQDRPELCLSVGSIVGAAQDGVIRLQQILSRPGFSRFQWVRIRHIRQAWHRYTQFSEHWLIQRYMRYRNWIQKANLVRLIVIPDPFSWLMYFSNQLILISLTRFFLVDLFLFVGKQAIAAYQSGESATADFLNDRDVEQTLEELTRMPSDESVLLDDRLIDIRNRLLGIYSLIRSPGIGDWKKSLFEALHHIACRHFPESPSPVDEAAVGPLLEQLQVYLTAISNSRDMPIIRRLHSFPLSYGFRIREMSAAPFLRRTGFLTKKVWNVYQWLSLPLRLFRILRKATPAGMAVHTGWLLVQKGCAYYFGRRLFNLTCLEIESVYSRSRKPVVKKMKRAYNTEYS